MSELILITNYFPYGSDTGEMYLRKEIFPLADTFDAISIFPCDANIKDELTVSNLPSNVTVYPIKEKSGQTRLSYLGATCRKIVNCSEQEVLEERRHLHPSQKVFLSYFMAKVEKRWSAIEKIMKEQRGSVQETYIYSYRFFDLAYLALLIKKNYIPNAKCISRAHGYDIYEERNPLCYLPMREYLLTNLDKVYPCSRNGVDYLKRKYPVFCDKIQCSYLGSGDYGIEEYQYNDVMDIVSCSNVISVKQVEKIARVIRSIDKRGVSVRWTHFGDGESLPKIKKENADMIEKGRMILPGKLSHDRVIESYQKGNYGFFINLSLSEGIPQAIMEAISFGIPAIATDVGGNSEIVREKVSGYLVQVTADEEQIADTIIKNISNLKELRKSTREFWDANFNAKRTAQDFICALLGL